MKKRPLVITVIGWIFIAFGSITLVANLIPYFNEPTPRSLSFNVHWMVHLARLLALVSGVFLLYGFNWARWLLVVWMAYHIVISIMHSAMQVAVHVILFGIIAYFLFRKQSSAFFKANRLEKD